MDLSMVLEAKTKKILHWNYRGLQEFPQELIQECENVQEVYLKWNAISYLPVSIKRLESLTNLYLFANQLSSLPTEIGSLELLQTLDVSQNQISQLPESICNLKNLENLIVTQNKLTCLPKDINKLTSLRNLQISVNSLTKLPAAICHCENIEELHLDRNLLTHLPTGITFLPKLQYISICYNRLLYLPSVAFISNPTIYFDNNPCLNYIPLPIGLQLCKEEHQEWNEGWSIDVYRCFESKDCHDPCTRVCVIINQDGSHQFSSTLIYLPPQLSVHKCTGKNTIVSLREQCLRTVHIQTNRYGNLLEQLPENLQVILQSMPMAYCLYCMTPMFTSVCMLVVSQQLKRQRSEIPQSSLLVTLYFCSSNCQLKYAEETLLKSNWEKTMLSTSLDWFVSQE